MADSLCNIQYRIALGEEKALAELYRLHHKQLQHFAKLLVKSNEVAEEVIEDVFVKIWTNRQKVKEVNNLQVYLYVAVKNRSLNVLSQKTNSLIQSPLDYLDAQYESSENDPQNLLIETEMMNNMSAAVECLPPKCKMIFKLIREAGLSYKEVAEILNISINTIDAQMAIAVKKICKILNVTKPSR